MDTNNVGFITFKNKDGSPRKFMITHYHGFYGTEKQPKNTYVDDGKFFANVWDDDILEEIQNLEVGDRHDEYGPCGLSHCAIYRYA